MQPALPLRARTTGNHVSPRMRLKAPSLGIVVLESVGPGARRNIWSASLSCPATPHQPSSGVTMAMIKCTARSISLFLSTAPPTWPTVTGLWPSPLQGITHCWGSSHHTSFLSLSHPCGSVIGPNWGPRLKHICSLFCGLDHRWTG